MSILNSVTLGMFYIQTALTLRDAMLLNSILVSSESWPSITVKQLKALEDVDISLFRKIFNSQMNSNKVLFFIETAKQPLRFSLSKRRLMFLHHLLTRDSNELIKKIYEVQKIKKTKGDWYLITNMEREKYSIHFTDNEISQMSKLKFKKIVNEAVNKVAFEYLIQIAKSQSKCKDILDNLKSGNLYMQKYLKTELLIKEEQQMLYSLRTNSYPVKANFRSQFSDMTCRTCSDTSTYENIQHLLQCDSLTDKLDVTKVKINDIFGSLADQVRFIKVFKKISTKRKLMLEL